MWQKTLNAKVQAKDVKKTETQILNKCQSPSSLNGNHHKRKINKVHCSHSTIKDLMEEQQHKLKDDTQYNTGNDTGRKGYTPAIGIIHV